MKNIKNIAVAHNNNKALELQYRINALNKLKKTISAYENEIYKALKSDLNKSEKETFLSEINEVYFEIDHTLKNIKKWAKPKKVKKTLQTVAAKSYLFYKPKGKVLLITPFNYPINLCFLPLIAAIAAGNNVLIKTSNLTMETNIVIKKIIEKAFENSHVDLIEEKDISNYDDLYQYNPDLVFFTGSCAVGKNIKQKCVANDIEFITELGGLCPCIVNDYDNEIIFKRIVWAKFLNAGQTCVSINHIFYNKNLTNFISSLTNEINSQFPNAIKNKNIVKLIDEKAFNRVVKIIDNEKSNVLFGGKYDVQNRIVEPTIIKAKNVETIKKYGEIFGPILFVLEYADINKTIDEINTIDNSPLAAYLYSNNNQLIEKFKEKINAGGYCVNDSLSHILNHNLPFGGVKTSGTGVYHGYYGFVSLSHLKPILINKSKKENKVKFINNELSLQNLKKIIEMGKKFIKG